MNYTNLNLVLDQYIENFELLNNPEHNEGMKWKAAKHFCEHWNLDASSFEEMFKEAMAATSVLFDSKTISPIAGLKSLMKKEGEEVFVKECFEELFVDDGGDLEARLNRVEVFRSKINSRIAKYWKGSFKYPQGVNHVIGYLSLWKPEENFMYKYSLIKEWNIYMEVSDNIGSGKNFSLANYYAVCESLKNLFITENSNVAFERRRKQVIELHKERMKNLEYNLGDGYNLLIYDILHCAKAYNFYNKIPKPVMVIGKKEPKVDIAAIEKLENEIKDISDQLDYLENAKVDFSPIVNTLVRHKTWGEGVVEALTDGTITVKFAEATKNLGLQVCIKLNYLEFKEEKINLLAEEELSRISQVEELTMDRALLRLQLARLK